MSLSIIKFALFIAIAQLIIGCSATERLHTKEALGNSYHTKVKSREVSSSCDHTETAFNCVKVIEVYDGDTIFVEIESVPPLFGKRIGVRLVGIDTPEMRSKNLCENRKAQEAKVALESFIKHAERVDIIDVQRDKYFRILGVVLADGSDVSKKLVKQKLAYPYHGERKVPRNWCQ